MKCVILCWGSPAVCVLIASSHRRLSGANSGGAGVVGVGFGLGVTTGDGLPPPQAVAKAVPGQRGHLPQLAVLQSQVFPVPVPLPPPSVQSLTTHHLYRRQGKNRISDKAEFLVLTWQSLHLEQIILTVLNHFVRRRFHLSVPSEKRPEHLIQYRREYRSFARRILDSHERTLQC